MKGWDSVEVEADNQAESGLPACRILVTVFLDVKSVLLIDFFHDCETANPVYYCYLVEEERLAYCLKICRF